MIMTSVGVQADTNDPEGILGVIKSFRGQLMELVQMNSSLVELNSSRGQSIRQSQAIVQDLEGKIQGLVNGASHMETMLRDNQHSVEDSDKILEELTNRKEHLDTEIRNLEMQVQCADSDELHTEQRLTGFAVEELYQKIDALSFLHHRLDRTNQDKQDEWDKFKADYLHQQEELKPCLEMKDHLDQLILARYIGMQSVKGADQSERDLAQRLCDHHWNSAQYRQLQQQLMEAQIKETDLEDEIGALFAKKRDLWRKCLDLENCLDELKGSSEEHIGVHPSPAYSNIPEVADGKGPTTYESDNDDMESEAETVSFPCHGTLLHRCPKSTNISIGEFFDDEKVQAPLRQGVGSVSDLDAAQDKYLDQEPQSDHDIAPAESDVDISETEPEQEADDEEAGTSESATQRTLHTGSEETPKATDSLIMKIRKRIGIGSRGSSMKIKSTTLAQTRSVRGFGKEGLGKRRR